MPPADTFWVPPLFTFVSIALPPEATFWVTFSLRIVLETVAPDRMFWTPFSSSVSSTTASAQTFWVPPLTTVPIAVPPEPTSRVPLETVYWFTAAASASRSVPPFRA